MKRTFFALLLLTALAVQSFAQTAPLKISPAERKLAEGVTAKQLSDYLYYVASDEMEGRDTPSRGLDLTAKFIGTMLSRWGFKPAGDDGTFFQRIAIRSETSDAANNVLAIDGHNFPFTEDFFRLGGNASITAPMVFARDGWMVRSKNIDPYRGVDVKGKIVVLYGTGIPRGNAVTSAPAGVTQDDLKGTAGTDFADPRTYARAAGAAGIIVVASPQAQAAWAQLKNRFGRGTSFPEKLRDASGNDLPVVLVSSQVGDAIFAGESAGKDSTTPFQLSKTATINANGRVETKWTQNVVAVWEGSDPVLKNEMVAIGAHYDHIGINLNARGDDKINNGADDDGSGTVSVLSIAEALAHAPARPKRSVLFVWHCGEEKGLWGSEYFNKFPTVDIKNVISQLNIDMIGRSRKAGDTNPKNKDLTDENSIYVIGADMMSSTLSSIVKGTNGGYLNLGYDYRYDDPKDPNRFFFRSDHFNYAVNHIPITFWFDGVHEDYHQPGDEPQKIDYNKMEKIARTILITLWKLTDLKERPKVDKTLPPELSRQ